MNTMSKIQRSPADAVRGEPANTPQIPPQERQHMIAEAAYYLAEHRHFASGAGDPVSDWLLAEAEIDQKLDEART